MIRRPNGVTFTFAAVTASRDEKDFPKSDLQSNRQTAEVVSRRQPHLIIFAYLFLYLFFQVSRAGESFFSCLSTSL